jgi:hypothetical protein
LAFSLTGAMARPPSLEVALARLAQLRKEKVTFSQEPSPDIAMLYAPKVTEQLAWLRERLDPTRPEDRFLIASGG